MADWVVVAVPLPAGMRSLNESFQFAPSKVILSVLSCCSAPARVWRERITAWPECASASREALARGWTKAAVRRAGAAAWGRAAAGLPVPPAWLTASATAYATAAAPAVAVISPGAGPQRAGRLA